jgi:hypothetical protein
LPATIDQKFRRASAYLHGRLKVPQPPPAAAKEYRYQPGDLDLPVYRSGVADARALLQDAAAHATDDAQNGGTLTAVALLAAGARLQRPTHGPVTFDPAALTATESATGVSSQDAVLRTAALLCGGKGELGPNVLERAAQMLNGIVPAHDVSEINRRIRACAGIPGVVVHDLGCHDGYPLLAVELPCLGPKPSLRVAVTGGLHGIEACGAGASMLLLEQVLANPRLRQDTGYIIIPAINGHGLAHGERRTRDHQDLNRAFGDDSGPAIATRVRAFLSEHPVDVGIDLHGDVSSRPGFWAYLGGDRADVIRRAIARFTDPATGGFAVVKCVPGSAFVDDGLAVSDNQGTLKDFFIQNGASIAVTLETPGALDYIDKVVGENRLAWEIVAAAQEATASS